MLGLSWNPAKEGIHFQKSEGLSSMERVSEGSTFIINCSVGFQELEILADVKGRLSSPLSPVARCLPIVTLFEISCPCLFTFLGPLDYKLFEGRDYSSFFLVTPAHDTVPDT